MEIDQEPGRHGSDQASKIKNRRIEGDRALKMRLGNQVEHEGLTGGDLDSVEQSQKETKECDSCWVNFPREC